MPSLPAMAAVGAVAAAVAPGRQAIAGCSQGCAEGAEESDDEEEVRLIVVRLATPPASALSRTPPAEEADEVRLTLVRAPTPLVARASGRDRRLPSAEQSQAARISTESAARQQLGQGATTAPAAAGAAAAAAAAPCPEQKKRKRALKQSKRNAAGRGKAASLLHGSSASGASDEELVLTVVPMEGKPPAVASRNPTLRARVRLKLLEHLRDPGFDRRVPASDSACAPDALAHCIEAALHEQLGGEREYLSQVRSIVFNLRDRSNAAFRRKLLDGLCDPKSLPAMTAEEMASDAKNAERAKVRQEAFAAITENMGEKTESNAFVCEKCAGTKTVYAQSMATESCIRSGGEPVMTAVTFVTCLACSHRWTERSGFA